MDFFHCMTCNACMSLSLFKAHVCRSKAMMADCPGRWKDRGREGRGSN